jgi:hypothetical protein
MLNKDLYDSLKAVFRDVSISNEGQAATIRVCTRTVTKPGQRKQYLHIATPGELYRVNCPFCGDTRQRLYINHRWNDQVGGIFVDTAPYTCVCYNEHCEKEKGFKKELKEILRLGKKLPTIVQGEVVVRPDILEWPGKVQPLKELPEDHGVIKWLRDERGFDITELSDEWGFSWVVESDSNLIYDTNRLIAPIKGYHQGKIELLGWQTRWYDYHNGTSVPPKKKIPKYLTQGKKNQLLYNGFNAVRNSPVVLCEGTFDAVRVGKDHGVCTFGKLPSPRQQELLWNGWGKYNADLVLAYDPDLDEKEWTKLKECFRDWKNVVTLPLPEGYDVADFTREQVWAIIDALGITKRKLY